MGADEGGNEASHGDPFGGALRRRQRVASSIYLGRATGDPSHAMRGPGMAVFSKYAAVLPHSPNARADRTIRLAEAARARVSNVSC